MNMWNKISPFRGEVWSRPTWAAKWYRWKCNELWGMKENYHSCQLGVCACFLCVWNAATLQWISTNANTTRAPNRNGVGWGEEEGVKIFPNRYADFKVFLCFKKFCTSKMYFSIFKKCISVFVPKNLYIQKILYYTEYEPKKSVFVL